MNEDVLPLENGDFEVKYDNLGQLQEEIDKLEDNIPDKRTKEYSLWTERINYLHNLYNSLSDDKLYKIV